MNAEDQSPGARKRPGTFDFVVRAAIVPALAAATKEGVVREMVEALCAAGAVPSGDAADVVRAILHRELQGSTGIGRGVALPHARYSRAKDLLGTVAVSRPGVAFDSLDGGPVHVLVLLLSPPDQPGPHLRALENISRCLRDDLFVRSLREATAAEAIGELLDRADRG
jgi:mannitol/fructose-specific phosphotransferase system IIA component (Ntr-type)